MKKIKLLLLAAALLCAAFSCEKAEAPKSSMEPTKESDLVPLILTTSDDTKTSLQLDGSIYWSDNDAISVIDNGILGGSENIHTFSISNIRGTAATFSGDVRSTTSAICAVYPSSLVVSGNVGGTSGTRDNREISVLVPNEQISKQGSFSENLNISVAKADLGLGNVTGGTTLPSTTNITFRNVCALLNFTIPAQLPDYWVEGDKIKSVTISSSVDIAGQMTIDYSGDVPVLDGEVSGSDKITMTGDFALGKTYWFVVAPVELNGISITVETEKGKVYRRSRSGKVQLNQGKYRSLGTLNFDSMRPITLSAEHTYGETEILTGTKLTLALPHTDVTAINLTVKHKTKGAVRTFTDASKIKNGVIVSDNTDASWPYLPVGTYTVSGFYTSAVDGTIEILNSEFSFDEAPKFNVGSYNAYTSWTLFKNGKVDEANSSNGLSIYFSISESSVTISDKILNNNNYNNLISVSFAKSSGEVASGVFNAGLSSVLVAPTSGAYSTPTYHFDEVKKDFAATTCSVTGIPHIAIPPTKSLGWSAPSSTDVVAWQSDKVTLTGAVSEPVIQSPKLYLPETAKVYLYVKADLYSFAAAWQKSIANMVVRSSGAELIKESGEVDYNKWTGVGFKTLTKEPTYTGTGLPTGEFNIEIVNTNRAATTVTVKDFQLKYSK